MREHVVIADEEFAVAAEEERRRRHDVMAHVSCLYLGMSFGHGCFPTCIFLLSASTFLLWVLVYFFFGLCAEWVALICSD